LCPDGAAILTRLPRNRLTNQDTCTGANCPDMVVFDTNGNDVNDPPYNQPGKDKAVDLTEIRDEWGNPLNYELYTFGAGSAARTDWEVRSAGPDGKFEDSFDRNGSGDSDDEVLRGR